MLRGMSLLVACWRVEDQGRRRFRIGQSKQGDLCIARQAPWLAQACGLGAAWADEPNEVFAGRGIERG